MKYGVIFVSKTGNTEKLAKAIYEAIADNSKDIQRLTEKSEYDFADTLFVGFWTDHGTCSIEVLNYLSELHDKNVVLFGTAGSGPDDLYYHRIEKQVAVWLPDDNKYLGMFMCQGKMPIHIRNKYESILEQGNQDDNALKMIRNFDEALLHPNESDYKEAEKFVNKIIDKLGDY